MDILRIAITGAALLVAPRAVIAQHDPHWSYEGKDGPEKWGTLAPSFAACATGTRQSPVDIPSMSRLSADTLRFFYSAAPVDLINNGHTVQANVADGDSLEISGHRYALKQVHFHTPAEHTIDGRRAGMEIHFVHLDSAARLAVIGVLVREGMPNGGIENLLQHVPKTAGQRSSTGETIFDPRALLPRDTRYWTYEGSLTTPPCTEGVRWIVLREPIEMSRIQVESLAETLRHNARPVQPLSQRVIGRPEPDIRD